MAEITKTILHVLREDYHRFNDFRNGGVQTGTSFQIAHLVSLLSHATGRDSSFSTKYTYLKPNKPLQHYGSAGACGY